VNTLQREPWLTNEVKVHEVLTTICPVIGFLFSFGDEGESKSFDEIEEE